MRTLKLITLSISIIFSINAQANSLCNVINKKEQQLTVAAPDEDSAEKMALNVCTASNIAKQDCNPDCYDNGNSSGRWHCSISNNKGQHWSYFAPTKIQAQDLTQTGCNLVSLSKKNCKPVCIQE